MLHLGDITKINGHNVPITDCVIFGAPCQDLSVAGQRKGMKHSDLGDEETTRSGLFIDAVRIIKEMREEDVRNGRSGVDVRPRYGIYENVPGAFSSNSGQDFRVVLEELARIVEEGVTIPRPAKGKWATTGVIIGDGWSLAWRVFDAQHWGVPQRRRRICIAIDFNGHTAPQIVFSEGEHHGSTERGNRKPSVGYLGEEPRSEVQPLCEGLSRHLESSQPQREDPSSDASGSLGADDCIGVDVYNTTLTGGKTCPLTTGFTTTGTCPKVMVSKTVCYSVDQGGGKSACNVQEGKAPTLACTHGGEPAVCYGIVDVPQETRYIVRRLTPLECERLQGFPDRWTDIGEFTDTKGKRCKTSDASRYKALGNSIALPSWKWVLKRLCATYERDATMASLFDGIGGFPHLWEQINGKGSCLWASEIEEFPIAVTKARIGDGQ